MIATFLDNDGVFNNVLPEVIVNFQNKLKVEVDFDKFIFDTLYNRTVAEEWPNVSIQKTEKSKYSTRDFSHH